MLLKKIWLQIFANFSVFVGGFPKFFTIFFKVKFKIFRLASGHNPSLGSLFVTTKDLGRFDFYFNINTLTTKRNPEQPKK